MGWNGSDLRSEVKGQRSETRGQRSEVRQRRDSDRCAARPESAPYRLGAATSSRTPYRRGLIAGALVVAVGCGVLWWFGRTRTPVAPQTVAHHAKYETHIAAHTPARTKATAVPMRVSADATVTNGTAKPARVRTGQYRDWIVPTPSGPKMRYEVFETHAENELAFLACMPIGTMVLGDCDYTNEDFMKQLQEALVSKIDIKPDDDEDVKFYKQSVIDLKNELKRMLKNGENIGEALNRTRKELQDLGAYKTELEREIHKIQNENEELTDDEVEDFVKAANTMLESKGIEKFEFNKLTREIIKRKPFPDPYDQSENGESEETNE